MWCRIHSFRHDCLDSALQDASLAGLAAVCPSDRCAQLLQFRLCWLELQCPMHTIAMDTPMVPSSQSIQKEACIPLHLQTAVAAQRLLQSGISAAHRCSRLLVALLVDYGYCITLQNSRDILVSKGRLYRSTCLSPIACRSPIVMRGLKWDVQPAGAAVAKQLAALGAKNASCPDNETSQVGWKSSSKDHDHLLQSMHAYHHFDLVPAIRHCWLYGILHPG